MQEHMFHTVAEKLFTEVKKILAMFQGKHVKKDSDACWKDFKCIYIFWFFRLGRIGDEHCA